MAGVFASMAVKWALDKLASFSFLPAADASSSSSTTVTTASEDVELLRRLERTMRRIHATLHDAEDHWNIREESAKLRLKELKELAYAAEDVVQEYDNELEVAAAAAASSVGKGKRCQEENETYSNGVGMVAVPLELVVQAKKIIERMDEIKEYSDNFTLSENDGDRRFDPDITTSRKTSSLVLYEKSIIGREKDKNKIVEKLVTTEGNSPVPVSVLAIVGMGGLGKTTLAQLVYNDPRVRHCFDVFAWVCVSERFDVCTITRNIISSVTKASCDLSELADLQEKLMHEVQDKKVLLVLDDVWNERSDLWESLCVPMSRTRICNIIVTTRSEAVARLMQTMPFYRIYSLNSEDSWSVFKQVAFAAHQDNNNIPVNLIHIGKNIVKKCKGLPLAIKTLGSILQCETDEVRRRDVLESKLWDLEESRSGVLPALELSYKHMPIYLKRCFVALSLFPKDFVLEEHNVVKLWKSLDLLQCDKNGEEDDIGKIYINKLVQRSLLEAEKNIVFGDYYKMNDLIHNLACFVGAEEFLVQRSLLQADKNIVFRDYYKMHDLIHDLACFLGAEEFFRIEGDTSIEIPPNVRYISVSGHGASLKNLTASHSIRAIIFLDEDELQEELPLNCKKLRAVSHNDNKSGIVLPRRIGCGINIHTLHMGLSGCGCFCNISGLRSLNKMRELSLSGLGSVVCVKDAEGAQLHSKKHLRSLALDFAYDIHHYCENTLQGDEGAVTLVSHEQLLESLQPHHVLRKLEIKRYMSESYPSWLGNASYSNLTQVFLLGCDSQHLPTLGELPSLKSLMVHYMRQVEKIGREFCSHIPGVKGFPSLTQLKFNWLPRLSEWSKMEAGEFPCLQTLSIIYAKKLRSLPPVPFMSLVTLRLRYCGNLAAVPELATLCELVIQCCKSVHQLPMLVSLSKLVIAGCPKLSAVGSLPSLTTLAIIGPFDDEDEILYRLLNCHPSLERISVRYNTTTRITLQPQSLPSLTKLHLSCKNLHYCDGLADLTSLQELNVQDCRNLHLSLPPRKLRKLIVRHFPNEWFDGGV